MLLLPIAGLLLLEQNGFDLRQRDHWLDQARRALAQGWTLAIIPLGFIGFTLYRQSLGLPPLNDVYNQYSYVFLTDPLSGLVDNLRWLIQHPFDITSVDAWALVIVLILSGASLFFKRHRRLPLIAYNFGFILFFASKVNYRYGTSEVIYTQSFARYALALFPLMFLIADGLLHARPLIRIIGVAVLLLGIVSFSALYVLALTGP